MWYETAYRRMVIDMHIPDWDARFLSLFDAHKYVAMIKQANAQSVVLVAMSHLGIFNYPSQVGAMHRGLHGHDLFGEVLDLCHQAGIGVVAYVSVIFDRWASDHHPEWRIKLMDGSDADAPMRFGLVCPNSPYRDYAARWTHELLSTYAVEGIRFDMTFWPAVCYCAHCQARFKAETGREIPRVINWEDPQWAAFQRKREEWLADFAGLLTRTAKQARPAASVEHQASTYGLDWKFGVSDLLIPHNDFLQGDFYGDALQGSFARKLLYNLSPHQPYGFETSISTFLSHHTNTKSAALVQTKAYAALAGQGAMIFIDAIDPVGTLNPRTYTRIGAALAETRRYDAYRGGEAIQDAAVYFSLYSKINLADKGKNPMDPALSGRFPHVDAALGACQTLITAHIPFGVLTKRSLDQLARCRLLILPDVIVMDAEEMAAVRQFVADGGCLYASKGASLISADGLRHADFMLSDVFGVHYQGETQEHFTFIAPAAGFEECMAECTLDYPLAMDEGQVLVSATEGTQVMGMQMLPYSDPADIDYFSSIHSNPPGIATGRPAITLHRFGKGQVIYAAAGLESFEFSRPILASLLSQFKISFSFIVQAPACVEATLFHQAEKQRYILNLLNFQKELPNLPVDGIQIQLRLEGKNPIRLSLCPDESPIPFTYSNDVLAFIAPRLETFQMFCLDYQPSHKSGYA